MKVVALVSGGKVGSVDFRLSRDGYSKIKNKWNNFAWLFQ